MDVCVAHRSHTPAPTYVEYHHVVPQAWQAHWAPPLPWPYQGASPDRPGLTLWDARTVALCRTGHGNVHHWLVAAMHLYVLLPGPEDDARIAEAIRLVKADARAAGLRLVRADIAITEEAMVRFQAVGGSLRELAAHGLWGEI